MSPTLAPRRLARVRSAILAGLLWLLASLPAAADLVTAISRSTTPPGTASSSSNEVLWDRNGRFALLLSAAGDLSPGQNTPALVRNAFLFDRLAGTVQLVSHLPGSTTAGPSESVEAAQISADGNWVVFSSEASDLVAGQIDGNDALDVFLWSRETDTVQLVSHVPGSPVTTGDAFSGLESDVGPVTRPVISADGQFVVFESAASDLLDNPDPASLSDVFLFNRQGGTLRLVSHDSSSGTSAANGVSNRPSLSQDGRWVAFETFGRNLVTGVTDGNGFRDIYLWDRIAAPGTSLQLLSRKAGAPTVTGNGDCQRAVISADGTGIAFLSAASDLEGVTSDTNGLLDAFHFDRPSNTLRLVSHRADSTTITTAAATLANLSISSDGDRVAFASAGADHVPGQTDANATADVFLWSGGPITLVSHASASATTAADAVSNRPILSLDGDTVAFESAATNLVTIQFDLNLTVDVFSWSRLSGTTIVVSHVPGNERHTGESFSRIRSVTPDGGLVGFSSNASDLVPDDDNGASDVFFHGGLLFADGFESGDLTAWTAALP